jgi:hypothetical protein
MRNAARASEWGAFVGAACQESVMLLQKHHVECLPS